MSTGSCSPAGLMTATETHVAPLSALVRRTSLSTQTLRPSASASCSSSNHSLATLRSTPRRKTAPLLATSSRALRRRTVLAALLPLFLEAAPTLRLSRFAELLSDLWRVLGATMTSASGEILTKSEAAGGAGATEVTMMLAVVVGDRWRVSGWGVWAWGLGRARIWERKLSSRNWACSSIISQSTGVRGSMLMVWACGGSRCSWMPTLWPSSRPTRRAKVASTSTAAMSCWLAAGLLRRPFLSTRAASLRRLCMPVQPTKTDLGGDALRASEAPGGGGWRYESSTTTFCATALALTSTETRAAGRLTRQFFSDGCRATSACTTLPAGFLGGMVRGGERCCGLVATSDAGDVCCYVCASYAAIRQPRLQAPAGARQARQSPAAATGPAGCWLPCATRRAGVLQNALPNSGLHRPRRRTSAPQHHSTPSGSLPALAVSTPRRRTESPWRCSRRSRSSTTRSRKVGTHRRTTLRPWLNTHSGLCRLPQALQGLVGRGRGAARGPHPQWQRPRRRVRHGRRRRRPGPALAAQPPVQAQVHGHAAGRREPRAQ